MEDTRRRPAVKATLARVQGLIEFRRVSGARDESLSARHQSGTPAPHLRPAHVK
jgi:hypothetical protein